MRMAQDFDAVNVRHFDVSDDEIVKSAVNLVLGRLAGLHGLDAVSVAAEGDIEHFADRALVVADQDVSHATSLRPQRPPVARAQRLAILARRCLRLPGRCLFAVRHRTAATSSQR